MHEVSIALSIVEELVDRTNDDADVIITAVNLRIGALAAIDTNALVFAWELATDGTAAAGSRLNIEHVPLAILCNTCDAERTIDRGTLPVCPFCGTPSATIIRGRELQVLSMEVVDGAADRGSPAEHSAQEQHAGA